MPSLSLWCQSSQYHSPDEWESSSNPAGLVVVRRRLEQERGERSWGRSASHPRPGGNNTTAGQGTSIPCQTLGCRGQKCAHRPIVNGTASAGQGRQLAPEGRSNVSSVLMVSDDTLTRSVLALRRSLCTASAATSASFLRVFSVQPQSKFELRLVGNANGGQP